ncbi:hypothetical protein SGFS_097930 [Streptomyces graminofaciens]|uniref:Uncharacterized protein n=1 Tax=Streptomyces graminofaciens TaxID=68212 RepID=A0ABN5VYJ1_9ACTN|nr:hypothetical protein [Streptomyces graminofaciens]BBC38499.1 hypothetical protein SGFS_097930 [Streptomyces graminofaciens]
MANTKRYGPARSDAEPRDPGLHCARPATRDKADRHATCTPFLLVSTDSVVLFRPQRRDLVFMALATKNLTIDSNLTWVEVEKRIAVEKDPVVLENLTLVHDHMKYESVGNLDGVLGTLCTSPEYKFHVPGFEHVSGNGSQESIREFYDQLLIKGGAHRLQYIVDRVTADRHAVTTEGEFLWAYPGRTLAGMGITVDDPDAYYAASCRQLIIWPRHATEPKLTGEEVWVDRDMFIGIAERKVTDFIDADPGDEWRTA